MENRYFYYVVLFAIPEYSLHWLIDTSSEMIKISDFYKHYFNDIECSGSFTSKYSKYMHKCKTQFFTIQENN